MTATAGVVLSAECTLGRQPDYREMHGQCRRTLDIPLPHSGGKVLLVRRCTCMCHARRRSAPAGQ
ncbi:hypothetical protein [Streptomyces sp. bgisy154]|uniref:hypothetical protein n=1 Tax=Streptomyces sp. bgisy154 TaxID=3413794 RepID=UPI003D762936